MVFAVCAEDSILGDALVDQDKQAVYGTEVMLKGYNKRKKAMKGVNLKNM